VKANPNIGVSVTLKYLREQVAEAIGMPYKQNIVKRLNFCFWTEQMNRWLDVELWRACGLRGAIDEASLEGRDCYLGLDLSSTTDLSSACALFPRISDDETPRFRVIWRFWIPRKTLAARSERERLMLEAWAAQGWITITEGDVIDYDVIRADLNALGERFAIRELAYDPWNATQIATQLQGDGFTVVPFRQGFATMNEPTTELEKLIRSADIDHGGHPVSAWMASNVAVAQDAAGNKKPDKAASADRIDGIVALIEAIGRATIAPADNDEWRPVP
jgi:phage terminase large subunit-like protein